MITGPNSKTTVPNLNRALQIMELLAANPKGLTRSEIASQLGIPGNSAYRITMTLLEQGYLGRAETTKAFCLTDKMMTLHCQAVDEVSLVERSWEIMRELRDRLKETIMLAVLHGDHGLVLESVTGPGDVAMSIRRGHSFKLHAGAPGKVILAFMDNQELSTLITRLKLNKFTDNTITGRKELEEELQSIRECGYASDPEEVMLGIKCVGVPIFDRQGNCVAALVMPTFVHRLPDEKIKTVANRLQESAGQISRKL